MGVAMFYSNVRFLTAILLVLTIIVVGTALLTLNKQNANNINSRVQNTLIKSININVKELVKKSRITIYITSAAAKHVSIKRLVNSGFNVTIVDNLEDIKNVRQKSILILNITDAIKPRTKVSRILSKLIKLTNESLYRMIVVALNPYRDKSEAKVLLGLIYKYFGYYGLKPIMMIDKEKSDKVRRVYTVSEIVLKAKGLAFSVKPNMFIVIDTLDDLNQTLLLIAKWAGFINRTYVDKNEVFRRFLGSETITNKENFVYVGSIGYITAIFNGTLCHEQTGYMAVKIDYYYANVTVANQVYHAWLAHVMHSAKGYQTTCCYPFPPFCMTYHHYPVYFVTKTDWNTELYPGQVLDNYEPKNFGSAATIVYTINWEFGANFGEEASATIEYSVSVSTSMPATPYYEWYDISDPPYGVAAVKHYVDIPPGFDVSKLDNVLFTVEPASIGYLDPLKLGGVPPMIVTHSFYTRLNTGDEASITFDVKLTQTSAERIGN